MPSSPFGWTRTPLWLWMLVIMGASAYGGGLAYALFHMQGDIIGQIVVALAAAVLAVLLAISASY